MTLALRDLQAAFAAHIMGADRADLVAAVVGDPIAATARLRASIAIMSSRASARRWPRPFPRCRRWSEWIFSAASRALSSGTPCRCSRC